MNGSPAKLGTISGTARHSSALKMKAASALKQNDPYADALKKDPNLPEYVKIQKSTTPGSDEYEANQAKINAAYGKTRSQKLKKAQIAKVEKETEVKPEVKAETVSAADATERKPDTKRDSIIGDENKDGNMLSRALNKLKQGKAKRQAAQIEKNKGTKYEGMTNFQKRQAIRAEQRKAK